MLAVSEIAADVINDLVASSGHDPELAGLRFEIDTSSSVMVRYALNVVALPGEDDEVLEADGARVFLDQAAAATLGEKMLDVEIADGRASFTLVDPY